MASEANLLRYLVFLVPPAFVACSGTDVPAPPTSTIHADEVVLVYGIPDDGRDPAVVAIDAEGGPLCTGVAIATNAVLTARHCVSFLTDDVVCPSDARQVVGTRMPPSLTFYRGDDPTSWQYEGRGAQVFVPQGDAICGADIAIVVLDGPLSGIKPLEVSELGAVAGDRVRSLGFETPPAGSPGTKLLREHVRVRGTTTAELEVFEATCQGDFGGPVLNETTGAVVGIASRAGPDCAGAGSVNIYTRADAFYGLIESALAAGRDGPDAGSHAERLPTDIGSVCRRGNECGAGVCVSENHRQYCSRSCDGDDKCPTNYSCRQAVEGPFVCVEH